MADLLSSEWMWCDICHEIHESALLVGDVPIFMCPAMPRFSIQILPTMFQWSTPCDPETWGPEGEIADG